MRKLFKNPLFVGIGVVLVAIVIAMINANNGGDGMMMATLPFVIPGMDEENAKKFNTWMKEQSEAVQTAVKGLLKDKDGKGFGDLITELKTFLFGDDDKKKGLKGDIAEMQKQLDTLETKLKKDGKRGEGKPVTFKSALRKVFEAAKSEIEKLSKGSVKEVNVEVKGISVTSGALIPVPDMEPGIAKPISRPLTLLSILPRRNFPKSGRLMWRERVAKTKGGKWVGKREKGNEMALEWNTFSAYPKKISAFIKIDRDDIKDIDFVMSEVNGELLDDLREDIDTQLYSGSGDLTSDTKNLQGLSAIATAFDADGFKLASGVVPNYADVIRVAVLQIRKVNGRADYCLVHPEVLAAMDLEKDSNGQYVLPPFRSADGTKVAGVTLLDDATMTKDEFMVFDSSKAVLRPEGMEIRMWEQNEDDALTDCITITGRMRMIFAVKNTDKCLFVKGGFTAAKLAIKQA